MQMNSSEHLSAQALKTIEGYLSYSIAGDSTPSRTISIPYYNNRRGKVRGGLRAMVGKGSPSDIREEVELLALREKLPLTLVDKEAFKKLLVDNHIGIDCSGFAYHVLNTESGERKKGSLRSHLKFPLARGIRGFIAKMRPAENAGVTTFASDINSVIVPIRDIRCGDYITMTHPDSERAYDHIVLVHAIEKDSSGIPKKILYSHSIAWPSDGRYGHGVRQGLIEISDIKAPIQNQLWNEANKTGSENYTHMRAQKAQKTEIRRLRWFV